MKYVKNRNGYSCFLACLESFLESRGFVCTQEQMIKNNGDLCCVVPDSNGGVLQGVVEHTKEGILCARIGINFQEVDKVSSVAEAVTHIKERCSYFIGISQQPDASGNPRMHAVLYDSTTANGVAVMDPDQGHKTLGTDYPDVIEIVLSELSLSNEKEPDCGNAYDQI